MCVPYWLVYLLHKSLEMRAFFSFREPQITGLAVEVPATNVLAYYGVISGSCEVCMHAHLLQSCLTHCESMECSLPGFSVHRILQARIWSGLPCPPPRSRKKTRHMTRLKKSQADYTGGTRETRVKFLKHFYLV